MSRTSALLLAVLLVGASAAFAGAAEPVEWNQEKATALAMGLAMAVDGMRDDARHQPPPNIAAGGAAARYRLLDNLRLIERETASLAAELKAGSGREETRPIFERLERLRYRTAEEARRMDIPRTVRNRIAAARIVLQHLKIYYVSE